MPGYRDAAVALWGEAGAYCHDSYADLRTELYPELPEQVPIVIGITACGHCLALTRARWDAGPRIPIASRLFGLGRGHVYDTLVHEMLHAWLHVTGRQVAHEWDDWYATVRELSPKVIGRELDVWRTPPARRRRSQRVPNPDYAPGTGQPKTLVRKVPVEDADAEAGDVRHARVARWPAAYRPAGYDHGAPLDCPTY